MRRPDSLMIEKDRPGSALASNRRDTRRKRRRRVVWSDCVMVALYVLAAGKILKMRAPHECDIYGHNP